MVLDWEINRAILLKIEAAPTPNVALKMKDFPEFDAQAVAYSMRYLKEKECIEAEIRSSSAGDNLIAVAIAKRLLPKGHDLLEAIKNDSLWTQIKEKFKAKCLEVFRTLAEQRESCIEEGHIMIDHVHMMISIPPKYSVARVVGYIKGKSAIHIARTYIGGKQNYPGQHFWARGYFVSTVGRDEAVIRNYIRNQEKEAQRLEQLRLV